MKKLLLPIFGGFLLVNSMCLTIGQNINTAVKIKESKRIKEEKILNSWQLINNEDVLTEEKIKEVQILSKNWNNEMIDDILNQAIKYKNNQLTIEFTTIDTNKIPSIVLENIDLSLKKLNNAIILGFIEIYISNSNRIQLIYQNRDSKLFYSTYSSYIWYSVYGPSRWWKFWEWGGYIHFSEKAVQNAKWINIFASIINIYFLFKNIKQLLNLVDNLSSAWKIGNINKVNILMKDISKLLGGIDLSLLGEIVDILAIITAVVSFGIALTTSSGWIAPVIELIISIIASVIDQMVRVSRQNGVKWQWAVFVIPLGISPE